MLLTSGEAANSLAELGRVELTLGHVVKFLYRISYPPTHLALDSSDALQRLAKVIDDLEQKQQESSSPSS